MWTNIERSIDGAVGRMMSWLTQPPVRAESSRERSERGVESATATVAEPASAVAESPTAASPEPAANAAARAAVERIVAGEEQASPGVAEPVDGGVEPVSDAVLEPVSEASEATIEGATEDDLTERILAALADAPEGLPMKGLVQATGATRYALRQRLNPMLADGRIDRKGQGMTTRYHAAET